MDVRITSKHAHFFCIPQGPFNVFTPPYVRPRQKLYGICTHINILKSLKLIESTAENDSKLYRWIRIINAFSSSERAFIPDDYNMLCNIKK